MTARSGAAAKHRGADGTGRRVTGVAGPIAATKAWWTYQVTAKVDQAAVIAKMREESEWSPRYAFMTCMSAGIAILGLLLSSPAVVIGAMLISPLMGPILGLGFALAIGDARWVKRSSIALLGGIVLAILFCALIVLVSPLQNVTAEIAARTRPNLFDLAVALFSALAGTYAMIKGREGTIVGVAIATALMPPLAVVGFGLASANWTVFGGSLLLFFTNLMTIALTAALMARLYGFLSSLSPKHSLVQSIAIFGTFIALAIPLALSLRQIAWEANTTRLATRVIKDEFGSAARLSQIDFDFASKPLLVTASVLTPRYLPGAEEESQRLIAATLDYPVDVKIQQFRVGTGNGDAEAAQIAAVQAKEQARESEFQITQLGERLALIAGVPANDVLIDRESRRAVVKARPLPGASLATYYTLEQRVAALDPQWSLLVQPPADKLAAIEMVDGEPSPAGLANLRLATWAAQRIDAPIGVSGRDADVARVLALLREKGTSATRTIGKTASPNTVGLAWLAPDSPVSAAKSDETP